jgi:hypothetical protein
MNLILHTHLLLLINQNNNNHNYVRKNNNVITIIEKRLNKSNTLRKPAPASGIGCDIRSESSISNGTVKRHQRFNASNNGQNPSKRTH